MSQPHRPSPSPVLPRHSPPTSLFGHHCKPLPRDTCDGAWGLSFDDFPLQTINSHRSVLNTNAVSFIGRRNSVREQLWRIELLNITIVRDTIPLDDRGASLSTNVLSLRRNDRPHLEITNQLQHCSGIT